MNKNISNHLESIGFIPQEFGQDWSEAIAFKGFLIMPEFPNGGMTALSIKDTISEQWWSLPTGLGKHCLEGMINFGYDQDEEAIAWLKDEITKWDISFQENQSTLLARHQQFNDLPDPVSAAISNALEPLGFSHSGEFAPIEFEIENYDWIEIGVFAIASNSDWIGVLNYSLMEYWSCVTFVPTQLKLSEIAKAVRELNDHIHTA